MKKIIYLLFAVFLLNSCDVSVDNPNTITTATFWKTETDAQYGINAVYNMFYKPGQAHPSFLKRNEGCAYPDADIDGYRQ